MEDFKKSTYWNVWADVYRVHKTFYGIREEDTVRWENLLEEAGKIRNKYKNTPEGIFAEKMVLLVAAELEDKAKSQKGESENAEKE